MVDGQKCLCLCQRYQQTSEEKQPHEPLKYKMKGRTETPFIKSDASQMSLKVEKLKEAPADGCGNTALGSGNSFRW